VGRTPIAAALQEESIVREFMGVSRILSVFAAGALVVGCADVGDQVADRDFEGPGIEIAIAALDLGGVEDAVWDIYADNDNRDTDNEPDPQRVFQVRITASQFGDGVGSASYVGPCDASGTVDLGTCADQVCTNGPVSCAVTADCVDVDGQWNTVGVRLIGIYGEPLDGTAANGGPGSFGVNVDNNAVNNPALPAQNPGLMTQDVLCRPNADVFVQFDVSILRPANQGFIDLAVNFNNIFCSAKYDCGTSADPINLLHDGNSRARTHVLGFACSGATGDNAHTNMYLDDIKITCGDVTETLQLPLGGGTLDGNRLDQSTNPPQKVGPGTDVWLYQWAVYSGDEQLSGDDGSFNKRYYNVALGIRDLPAGCTISTKGTADSNTGPLTHAEIAAGSVYPYVKWEVTTAASGNCVAKCIDWCVDGDGPGGAPVDGNCDAAGGTFTVNGLCETPTNGNFPLTFSDVASVKTVYTSTSDTSETKFDNDLFGTGAIGD